MPSNVLFGPKHSAKTKEEKKKNRKARVKGAVGDAILNSTGSMGDSMKAGMAVRAAVDKRRARPENVKAREDKRVYKKIGGLNDVVKKKKKKV
jgi:uncharacterized protein (DUF849 family)